jgi:hypothetical protein
LRNRDLETGYVWIEFVCPFRILLGGDVGFIGCDMVALVVEFALQTTDVAVRVAGGVKGAAVPVACVFSVEILVVWLLTSALPFSTLTKFQRPIALTCLLVGLVKRLCSTAIMRFAYFASSSTLRFLPFGVVSFVTIASFCAAVLLCCCAAESGLLLGARRRWLWRDFECSVVTGAQTEVSALCRAWWLVAALRQRLPVIVIVILFIILDGGSADETRRRKER